MSDARGGIAADDQEVRHRQKATSDPDSENADSDIACEGLESEQEELIDNKMGDVAAAIGQGTAKNMDILESALAGVSPRWRNWITRGFFSMIMFALFSFVIYLGPFALMALTLVLQVKCFSEIINIGYAVYRIHGLPWFRSLSWWFLLCSNYFFYGESMVNNFVEVVNRMEFLRVLVTYHRLISFLLYITGFVWFVLSLVKKYYMKQFSLFAWTHVALLIVVTQSYLIIQNIFEGMIWFIVPVSMIIINDFMAYMFGFFFGRTPLIKLSPKKTWEGFIGGGVATVVLGLIMAQLMCSVPYFVCPLKYDQALETINWNCQLPAHFLPQQFQLPRLLATPFSMLGLSASVSFSPFLIHAFVMSLFSSIIGPFGGFFASGFKRAFKIKDFGDLIPGHGGIMDRFDCQFLMATFVNVYISSFVRSASLPRIMQQILSLPLESQVDMYNMLRENLLTRELIQ